MRKSADPKLVNDSSEGDAMKSRPVVVLAFAVALSMPLFAHHGSAAFDTGKKVTLKGTVQEWVYSNPHCLLRLEVKGDDGQVVQWVAEGQAPNVIFPAGYRRDSFKPGDQVTITVEPVKNGGTSDVFCRPCSRMVRPWALRPQRAARHSPTT